MATFRLAHFSSPEILNSIQPERFRQFLEPFRDYLHTREISLADTGPLDLARLSEVLLAPDDDTPGPLIDALYFVDRMANLQAMSDLLDAARQAGIQFTSDELSPADVAVQVWLERPALLERLEAEQFLEQPRSYDYYQVGHPTQLPERIPTEADRVFLEEHFNDWFESRHRGRTARVFLSQRNGATYFLIRHGQPFKREETLRGNESASVAYRPLTYDVAIYDPTLAELKVHALLKGERQLYRNAISTYLFGQSGDFSSESKYTLTPLHEDGERCLSCADVPGLEKVVLKELHFAYGGKLNRYRIEKANDLFAVYRERGSDDIPEFPRVSRAVFSIWFPTARRPRSVTIKLPNTALYNRKGDSTPVERWLELRGFLKV